MSATAAPKARSLGTAHQGQGGEMSAARPLRKRSLPSGGRPAGPRGRHDAARPPESARSPWGTARRAKGGHMSAVRARDASVGGCLQASIEQRADGSVVLRSTEPLGPYPAQLTDWLEHWARVARRTQLRRTARRRWSVAAHSLRADAGACATDRAVAARHGPVGRAAAGDPVGQQPGAPHAGHGRDVGRRAVRAGVAGVLAAVQGSRQAASTSWAP